MISVADAKKIISENVSCLPPGKLPLSEAGGRILAEDIVSSVAVPAFPQSSMDGYAFRFADWQASKFLTITGVVPAGAPQHNRLLAGDAVRIFTGAAVPAGADTVVMQEKTTVNGNQLVIDDEHIQKGMHLRPAGTEIQPQVTALAKETKLSPAAIGFLAMLGITEVLVYPLPSVSIIVTGSELQPPGQPLAYGQVYEANSFALKAALEIMKISPVKLFHAADDLAVLTATLSAALQESDLVFLTGGISVGDFDFVLEATVANGVEKLFHKIKQRPAKPLYFGKKNDTYIFGLPGNPASGLVSFYEYALPAISKMSKTDFCMQQLKAPLEQPFAKPAGLTHFLKGWFNGETVSVLGAQESYRLSSFAGANCLIQVDEAITEYAAGTPVEVHLLPI